MTAPLAQAAEHAHHVQHHHHGGGADQLIALALLALLGLAYLTLAWRQRAWSRWRTAAFLAGLALVAVGLSPSWIPYPTGDFREHMIQHLLIGMIAPLGLVMAAPITLVLRSVPARHGRVITRGLRSWPVRIIAHPIVALTLNIGGMGALYFTPLYALAAEHPFIHHLIHIHFLAAGCLFAWVIAGPDPAPHRPSVKARLWILGVAIAIHASLSQLLYAGYFVALDAPAVQLRGGAQLMYYGGDIAELLLAFALVSTWRPKHTPARPRPPQANERA